MLYPLWEPFCPQIAYTAFVSVSLKKKKNQLKQIVHDHILFPPPTPLSSFPNRYSPSFIFFSPSLRKKTKTNNKSSKTKTCQTKSPQTKHTVLCWPTPPGPGLALECGSIGENGLSIPLHAAVRCHELFSQEWAFVSPPHTGIVWDKRVQVLRVLSQSL